jgi:hypothetical protein
VSFDGACPGGQMEGFVKTETRLWNCSVNSPPLKEAADAAPTPAYGRRALVGSRLSDRRLAR